MFIHKTTAVWLFQEGERVSADCLFRVREIQPYTTNTKVISSSEGSKAAIVTKQPVLEVGNMCFQEKRQLYLANWQGSSICILPGEDKKTRQYRATTVNIKENLGKVGVLCLWFVKTTAELYTLEYNESDLDMTSHNFVQLAVTYRTCGNFRGM